MQTVRYPGWRTMTSAQRYNAKSEAMFERARQQGHTTFNAERDVKAIEEAGKQLSDFGGQLNKCRMPNQ